MQVQVWQCVSFREEGINLQYETMNLRFGLQIRIRHNADFEIQIWIIKLLFLHLQRQLFLFVYGIICRKPYNSAPE